MSRDKNKAVGAERAMAMVGSLSNGWLLDPYFEILGKD